MKSLMKPTFLLVAMLALAHVCGRAAAKDGPEDVTYRPDVTFTLSTGIAEGKLVFFGEAGDIKGQTNPTLRVPAGAVVQVNLVNGDGAIHDFAAPDFGVKSDQVVGKGASTSVVFRAEKDGDYFYFCTLPGHRAAGMEGHIIVGAPEKQAAEAVETISRDPTDIPAEVGGRGPQHVEFKLHTVERKGELADGTTYRYWTFNNRVPGPFLRLRVGDTATVTLSNDKTSTMIHSVDMHAVTGPGGGASVMQVPPGQTRSFEFKALKPGIFIYHCATPMVAQHIANGMYGMILVEPEGGLPKVDREFYVMQGEMYTAEPFHTQGENEFSLDKMLEEQPTYYVLNGAVGSLTETYRMQAKVGETVRIFFGVGGPNASSSFHVIGEMFDRLYREGDLVSAPARDVQTTTVAPGGATMVEFKVEYPGKYILVDHALSRMEHGLAGFLWVEGDKDDSIFKPGQ